MMRAGCLAVAALAAGLVHAGSLGAQVTAGQVDTFEDGTTQGWGVGGAPGVVHPAPPVNVATGGPGGVDDGYLLVSSFGGQGPGSRFSFYNMSQWAGDYGLAGIGGIRFDANNFGPDEVFLRLLLVDPAGGPPSNIAVSSLGVVIPAGSGWGSYLIPIGPADLNVLLGTAEGARATATELRFFHNPAPVFGGPGIGAPAVSALVGFDNITAVAVVPEPGTVLLLASGLLLLLPLARRHRGR